MLASRAAIPVEIRDVPDERFDPSVEATAYFVAAEALTNVVRYAEATGAQVEASRTADRLTVVVADDGPGIPPAEREKLFLPYYSTKRRGSGLGWVTAEYAMLPRATNTRGDRESVKGRLGGRTQEISRLVGRSLRACVDYKALGENTIVIDCDVLQADGGTRTAAVTGGYVALAEAVAWLKNRKRTKGDPLLTSVSAVSVGIVDGEPRLDLCYEEDVAAQTDMNVVCTASGDFVEIQGTAEREPFSRDLLGQLLDLAVAGCGELTRLQDAALALSPGPPWPPPSRM